MSTHLTQDQVIEYTGRTRADAQERALRNLGYIVIGRNPRGQVQALAMHPNDPRLKASNDHHAVALDLG